jgi:hypothetical protein
MKFTVYFKIEGSDRLRHQQVLARDAFAARLALFDKYSPTGKKVQVISTVPKVSPVVKNI